MRKIILIAVLLISVVPSLSGCYTMAVGAAGAGAGYIAKDEIEDEKDGH